MFGKCWGLRYCLKVIDCCRNQHKRGNMPNVLNQTCWPTRDNPQRLHKVALYLARLYYYHHLLHQCSQHRILLLQHPLFLSLPVCKTRYLCTYQNHKEYPMNRAHTCVLQTQMDTSNHHHHTWQVQRLPQSKCHCSNTPDAHPYYRPRSGNFHHHSPLRKCTQTPQQV